MPLNGNIETVSLAGILQLLCHEEKTGILRIRNESTEFQIYFLDGNILYAIESYKEARLGHLLIRDGVVSSDVIQGCLRKARQEKLAIGKILVDDGHITPETLEKYVYNQILEIICDTFLWESGEFLYQDMKYNLRWLVVVKLSTLQLVMEASKRVDEVNRERNLKAVNG